MGDRGNINFIEHDGGEIYFYTHWCGTELPQILAKALDRGRDRWTDESYLARIIFSEMIRNEIDENTGYGISTSRQDYNYSDLIVNCKDLSVRDRENNVLVFDEFIEKYL